MSRPALDEPFDEPSAKPRAKRPWFIVVGGVLVALGGLGAYLGLRALIDELDPIKNFPSPVEFELSEAQREALFTYDDLRRAQEPIPSLNGPEVVHAQDEWRGWYVNYRAGLIDQAGGAVECALSVEHNRQAARAQYERWRRVAGLDEHSRVYPRFEVEPIDFAWGDRAQAGVLLEDGEPIGVTLLVRAGLRVIWLEWRGPILRGEELIAVVDPSLQELASLERTD